MNTELKISNKNLLKILLLSMCFQNIEIINFGTFGLKLFHIVGICLLPILIAKRKKMVFPPRSITFFLLYLLLISCIKSIEYGFHSLNFNYIFSYYLLILLFTISQNLKRNEWEDLIKDIAMVALICVYLNAFINRNTIIMFFRNPSGHPVYKFIFGGGANLEATWIGMFGIFFKNDKRAYVYIPLCVIISALLASRVGIIIDVIAFCYITFGNGNEKNKRIRYGIFTLFFVIVVCEKTGIMSYLFNRLENIGTDTGSTARLLMWKCVLEAFLKNPLGYGLGNSIKAINTVSTTYIGEGNIHNLYFQMLLDAGIFGLSWYVSFIVKFVKKEFLNIMENPVVMYIITYFLLGFVQFRGGDALMFFFVGIYIIEKQQLECEEKYNENNQENYL